MSKKNALFASLGLGLFGVGAIALWAVLSAADLEFDYSEGIGWIWN